MNYTDFTNCYRVDKTLRFGLIPQGETLANMEKLGVIAEDRQRKEDYMKLKPVIDRMYRSFIDQSLGHVNVDWEPLYDALIAYRQEKSPTAANYLEEAQAACRKEIADTFEGKTRDTEFNKTQKLLYGGLFGAKMFCGSPAWSLPGVNLTFVEKALLKSFNGFTGYFKVYFAARANLFTAEAKHSAIANRLVNENFAKFVDNCEAYSRIVEAVPTLKEALGNVIRETGYWSGYGMEDILSPGFYSRLLRQGDIDFFNQLIGGIAGEPGTPKIQGWNEVLNLAMQQDKNIADKLKGVPHRFVPLYKQLLSEQSTLSFIPESFHDDGEVIAAVKGFMDGLRSAGTINTAVALFHYLPTADLHKIYIHPDQLSNLSQAVLGKWSLCRDMLYAWKMGSEELKPAKKKVKEKAFEKWVKNSEIPLADIQEASGDPLFCLQVENKVLERVATAEERLSARLPENVGTDANKSIIKSVMDPVMDMYHVLQWFVVGDNADKDSEFYAGLDEIMEAMAPIIPLYNQVRNYVTKKPYSLAQFKLNFTVATLANGWDVNKERDNCAVLLLRDGNYYLGILNAQDKLKLSGTIGRKAGERPYEKVIYKQIQDFTKMLPKCTTEMKEVKQHFTKSDKDYVLFNKKFLAPLTITKEIFDLNHILYNGHKKIHVGYLRATGDTEGYRKALHTWIEFAKRFVQCYASTSIYDISVLKPTDAYERLDEFYGDLNRIAYKLDFVDIPEKEIDGYVAAGQLFLFQIYNKDFAKGAYGAPNMNTLLWKAVFDSKNMENVVIKLNGGAELFYRPRSITKAITHKIGEKTVNRTLKNGLSLTNELHREIYLYANGRNKKPLSEQARFLLPQAVIHDVEYDITKDRRFTEDKFFFHVPLTLNFKAGEQPVRFNDRVREYLMEHPETYIIGIDRGERNLIYAVVIDPDGNIVEQKSFNVINGIDYRDKLDQREKERANARQAWTTIGKIKDLKQGYLSLVVHEISEMMVRYQAVVVLENLNLGFKRVRVGIAEKSVYQEFEKMLINKLNYLAFKNVPEKEPGGILNAYQLSNIFESFEKMGAQSGFLFYVPAAFTSRMDPATGFYDPFRWGDIKTIHDKSDFLAQFKKLNYNNDDGSFILRWEPVTDKRFQWGFNADQAAWDIVIEANTVRTAADGDTYIAAKRIDWKPGENGQKQCEQYLPNNELVRVLHEYGIAYEDGRDILPAILVNNDNKLVNTVYKVIRLTLQMRNTNPATGEDYFSSAVADTSGRCFDTRAAVEGMPTEADANDAYHIALKGLLAISRMRNNEKIAVSNAEWVDYARGRH